MSTSGRKAAFAFPLKAQRASASRADIEWERIMVQITFAFVIILGYLLSVGMNEAQKLASDSELHRQRNIVLESLVHDLRSTEVGLEREERIAAQRELQLERLLRTWSVVREEREFYQLLAQFRYADFIPLSDDSDSLPVGEGFQRLNQQIDRIFLADTDEVSSGEMVALIEQVLVAAGFDPRASLEIIDETYVPPELMALYLDRRVPTLENLRKLKLQVGSDLLEERRALVQIQYDLVAKIAAARLERLTGLPREDLIAVDSTAPDVGVAVLEQIVNDLKTKMRLLPETASGLRGQASPAENLKESDPP